LAQKNSEKDEAQSLKRLGIVLEMPKKQKMLSMKSKHDYQGISITE